MTLLAPPTVVGEKQHLTALIHSSGSETTLFDTDSEHHQRRPSHITSNVASRSRSQRRDNLWYNFVPAVAMTTLPFIAIIGVLVYLVFS